MISAKISITKVVFFLTISQCFANIVQPNSNMFGSYIHLIIFASYMYVSQFMYLKRF